MVARFDNSVAAVSKYSQTVVLWYPMRIQDPEKKKNNKLSIRAEKHPKRMMLEVHRDENEFYLSTWLATIGGSVFLVSFHNITDVSDKPGCLT